MGVDLSRSRRTLLIPTDGRIAIGKKNEKNYPVKLDHFIFTHPLDPKTDIAPIHGPMSEAMKKCYGEKPRKINVILPFYHPDEVFYTSFVDWKGKKEWSCKSEDGHIALRKLPDGSIVEVPCDYDNCKFRLVKNDPFKTTCKPSGILSVYVKEAPVTGGVWKFRTGSWNSIYKISETLKMIFQHRHSLEGLEVTLSVTMEPQIVPDGKGGRQKQNIPLVQIAVECSIDALETGAKTPYGDFKEIQDRARIRGNLPDTAVIKELSMELATPPSIQDEDEESSSGENKVNPPTEGNKPSAEELNQQKPPIETPASTSYTDDDLF